MPEIPLYTGGGGPRVSAEGLFARASDPGIGDAISKGANGLGAYLDQQADERDKLWALRKLGEWKNKWTADLQRRDMEETDPEGFTPRVMEQYDVDLDGELDGAPSDNARQFLAVQMAQFRPAVYNDALKIETGKYLAAKSADMTAVIENAANFALTNPKMGADAIQMGVSAAEASGLPSEMRGEAKTKAVNTIARSWVEGMGKDRAIGPYKTLDRLVKGDFDKILSPSDRRVLENMMEQGIREGEATAKADANGDRRRWAASFEDHKKFVADGHAPTAADMDRFSDTAIDAMFPDEPEAAAASKREMAVAYAVGKVLSDPEKKLPEIKAEAAAQRAKAGTSSTAYGEVDARVGAMEAAVARREAALVSDGGAYVQDDPVIQSVTEQIQTLTAERDAVTDAGERLVLDREINALYDEWLDRTYKAQLANGAVSPSAPKSFIAQQVERINTLPPGELPGAMAELRERFASNFHRVVGEIQSKLQTKTRALFTLPDTPTSKMLADGHTLSNEDLLQGIPEDSRKVLNQLFAGDPTMNSFVRSAYPMKNGKEVAESWRDATLRGSAMYVKQGLSPQAAWKKARDDVTSEYTLAHIGGVPYRLPRSSIGGEGMQRNIEQGAYNARGNFTVQPTTWIPRGMAGKLGEAFTAEQYQAHVRRNGYYVTTGDDRGLALYSDGYPVHAIVNGQKQHVTFTWEQLRQTGQFHFDKAQKAGERRKGFGSVENR